MPKLCGVPRLLVRGLSSTPCNVWFSIRKPRASANISHQLNVPGDGWDAVTDDFGRQPYRVARLPNACVSASKFYTLRTPGNWTTAAYERGLVFDRSFIYDANDEGTQWLARLPRPPRRDGRAA